MSDDPLGYHSNPRLLAEVERLAAHAPGGRAVLVEAGRTVRGQPIPAVRVSSPGPDRDGRPRVLVSANVHGNEVISSELAMALLADLAASTPTDAAQALLGRVEVVIVPAVNLDSRAAAADALIDGRLFARAPRGNANGVDLNRNFPWVQGGHDPWHPMAGSSIPWMPWYRGPEPLSEPEALALAELAERDRPVVALNLHSVGRLFLYPWNAYAEPPPHLDAFVAIGEAFCASQPGPRYQIKQAQAWYGIMGDMDDWLYERCGTLAMTVELSGAMEAVRERPTALFSPASWMNPVSPGATVRNSHVPCLMALLEGLNQAEARAAAPTPVSLPSPPRAGRCPAPCRRPARRVQAAG